MPFLKAKISRRVAIERKKKKLSVLWGSLRRHSAAVALATVAKEASGFGASVTAVKISDLFGVNIQDTA
jgi:hypothetical protein